MHSDLIEMLVCPSCHGELEWSVSGNASGFIEAGRAACRGCSASYPVRDGTAVFLTPDLPREDLWQQTDSHLSRHLRDNPETERRLLRSPLEQLAPADRFFRSLVLDERGEYAGASAASESAMSGLYTPEYLKCLESQSSHVIESLGGSSGPVVDLASGMGFLVRRMAMRLRRPIVATDLSPLVLSRMSRRLAHHGLGQRVSFLAFDARRTPFRNGSVATLTTYQGLANIAEPGELLGELRRIVSGVFLSVSIFYPEDDAANSEAIRGMGLGAMLFRRSALEGYAQAGWRAEAVNSLFCPVSPTPVGEVLHGAGVDALPVADTMLETCVVMAE